MEALIIVVLVIVVGLWLFGTIYNAADKAHMKMDRLRQRQKRRGW
jgi:hypothetical protein